VASKINEEKIQISPVFVLYLNTVCAIILQYERCGKSKAVELITDCSFILSANLVKLAQMMEKC